MSTTHDPIPQGDVPPQWLIRLHQKRKQVAYVLLGLALLLALIPLATLIKFGWDSAPVTLWGGLLALIALGAGLYLTLAEPEGQADMDRLRLLVLGVGGLSGFVTWLLSLALAWKWRATVFGGVEAWQGENWWHLWVSLLALFGGMALMFVSLLPARAVEHSEPTLRRLLYGYNAVLTGLLLLVILGVVNVLVYNYFNTAFDWTESAIYTLSDQSKNILKALDKPTEVHVIVAAADDLTYSEVKNLLDNCRAINDKVQVTYLSPDLDRRRVAELASRYQFIYREGILVTYGTDPDIQHQFLRKDEIVDEGVGGMRMGSSRSRTFKGEDALISALSFLQEGKSRPVVYFTQGNGELDLTDAEASQLDRGAGALRERLQKSNYEVKGLQFGEGGKSKNPLIVVSSKVPDDATIVILAAPRTPLPEPALQALREYMNPPAAGRKKGKLVVLLDVVLDANGNMARTGLEEFLAEWNVQVGNDRILRVPTWSDMNQNPTRIRVVANPGLAQQNPVAQAFSSPETRLLLFDVRTVQPVQLAPNRPEAARVRAETLMLTDPFLPPDVWTVTTLKADPYQLMKDMARDEQAQNKLASEPLSVAVAVSEPVQPSDPSDPHAFMRQQDQKPRLVVFGDATFASNQFMAEGRGFYNFPLFSSTLAWLRERPSNIGLPPKSHNTFALNVSEDVSQRMRWLPAVLMFVGILGLGTGVWVVRRR